MNRLSEIIKQYKNVLLVFAGLNAGMLVFNLALGSTEGVLLNLGTIALLLLSYELNSD